MLNINIIFVKHLGNNILRELPGEIHLNIYVAVQQDQFERLLPTFIQVIDLTKQEESEYWAVVAAVFEGKPIDSVAFRPTLDSVISNSIEASINNKVRMKLQHVVSLSLFC